jgi:hypothetical protein
MQNGIDDDEYVTKLLKQDAKTTVKKYEMVGLDAFLPQRYSPVFPLDTCRSLFS